MRVFRFGGGYWWLVMMVWCMGVVQGKPWHIMERGKYGFIDGEGKVAIKPVYEGITGGGFHEGVAGVKKGGKWGFIDDMGRWIIPPIYEEVRWFSEGAAAVRKGRLWGYVNKKGEVIIPFKFQQACPFREGLALVVVRGSGENAQKAFIDTCGRVVFRGRWYCVGWFENGMAVYCPRKGGKWGYLDSRGGKIYPRFDEAEQFFSCGYALVKYRGKWGMIDKRGRFVLPARFEEAIDAAEGMVVVKKGGRWGVVRYDGKEEIPFVYESMGAISEGLIAAKRGGKWGAIDLLGRVRVPFKFEHVSAFMDGLSWVKVGGKVGVIDRRGRMIVAPRYAGGYVDGELLKYIREKEGGGYRWGYLNKKGEVVWEGDVWLGKVRIDGGSRGEGENAARCKAE